MNIRAFIGALMGASILSVTPLWAQSLEKIVEGAKKEGKLKVGLTVRWEEAGKPGAKKFVEVFQTRYPFLKVEYERVGGSRERERVLTELAAGRVSYDVTVLSETQVPTALQANVTEKVDWKALGVTAQHVHPDGFGVNYRSQLYGIAYNRSSFQTTSGENSPGRIARRPSGKKRSRWIRDRVIWKFFGNRICGDAKKLWRTRAELAANQTIFERDRTGAMTKLALGEYAIDCGSFYSTYYEHTRSGRVERIGFTLAEPIPVNLGDVVFIPRGAAHPNGAKLWIAWSLSEEGQKLLDEVEGNGSPLIPGTQTAKLVKGKKAAWYEPQYRAKAEEILKEILEAIGLPIVR